MSSKTVVVLFLIILLTIFISCIDEKKIFQKFVSEDTDKFARDFIELVRQEKFERVGMLADPEIMTPEARLKLQEIPKYLGDGEITSIEVVTWNVTKSEDKKRTYLMYELHIEDRRFLVNVVVDNILGRKQIFGFHVNAIDKSLEKAYAFSLSDKSLSHYLMLLTIIMVPIFIIYTAVLCIRTKVKMKWLWIIFILIGIGKLSLNWTTGDLNIKIISFNLLGLEIVRRGLYHPWIVSFSIPVGAIAFMIKRRILRKNELIRQSVDSEITSEMPQRNDPI